MPATLTAEELDGLQETAEENLPDVCFVVTMGFTKDARGNVTEQATLGPAFACRIKPVGSQRTSAQEGLILQRLGVIEAWKIRAPKAIAVALKDRIRVVVGETSRDLEIVASPGPRSRQSINTFLAVEIK